jgi:hypothetical protein
VDAHHEAVERAEAEGTLDMYAATPPELAAAQGIRHARIGGAACLVCRGLPGNRMFNHVLGLEDAERLGEIADWYAGDDEWFVAVADGTSLAPALEQRGFEKDYAWAKFSRATADPPEASTDLRVEEIGPEHGQAMGRIATAAFGMPDWAVDWLAALPGRDGWHCFVAFDGSQPAATASMFVSGGVGWLGIAGTDSAFRRRGAQGALLAARIGLAGELGCEWVTTETGEAVEGRPSNSYRNITRAGFEELYVRPNYRAP